MKYLIIITFFILSSCASSKTEGHKYMIEYLESDKISYVDKIQDFDEFTEDAIVYELVNGKYIKIIQIFE